MLSLKQVAAALIYGLDQARTLSPCGWNPMPSFRASGDYVGDGSFRQGIRYKEFFLFKQHKVLQSQDDCINVSTQIIDCGFVVPKPVLKNVAYPFEGLMGTI